MTLFDGAELESVQVRVASLTPGSRRQWGKMTVAQMAAHCGRGTEMALGDIKPPRMLIGRVLGPIVKPKMLQEREPMRRNSPTMPSLVASGDLDLETEKARLADRLNRFSKGGAEGCTRHPHAFFGRLSPDEWAILMYKHMDHHLRQFNA